MEEALHSELTKRDENKNVQRKQCLEISRIPKPEESKTEWRKACRDTVAVVLKYIGADEVVRSIDGAHRKMNGQMMVRFKERESRNIVYDKRFQLTEKTSNDIADLSRRPEGEGIDLYINEFNFD